MRKQVKLFRQGLKPARFVGPDGTAEAVPYPKPPYAEAVPYPKPPYEDSPRPLLQWLNWLSALAFHPALQDEHGCHTVHGFGALFYG